MRPVELDTKIDNTLISAKALYAAEKENVRVFLHTTYTKTPPRELWNQYALIGQDYLRLITGKNYDALKKWQRGPLKPVTMLGTAPLFDVGYIEHLLHTEKFAESEDALCDEAQTARLFWLWPPRHALAIAKDSPAERLFSQPIVQSGDFGRFVNERLGEVAELRRKDEAEQQKAKAKRKRA